MSSPDEQGHETTRDEQRDGSFLAGDGTQLAYHSLGAGPVLVCLPGGPLQAGAYLGDLAGLDAYRQLIVLDLPGSGGSAAPADLAGYRCDRLVDVVEDLRQHLGLERIDVLAHSAGTNLALLYAERHPDRIGRLVLLGPSGAVLGLRVRAEQRRAVADLRRGEPWFPPASAVLDAVLAGQVDLGEEAERDRVEQALAPFSYGRWDNSTRAHHAAGAQQRNAAAAVVFAGPGVFDPPRTRARLASLAAPVLLLAGEFDVNSPVPVVHELARCLPRAEVVVQSGAGHLPWLDDGPRFVQTVVGFLTASDHSST